MVADGGAVEVSELVKTFKETTALAGVDLEVPEGTVLGLLGPNGAGKTTVVRILATLLKADSGRATVFGQDVVTHAGRGASDHRADRPVRGGRRVPDRATRTWRWSAGSTSWAKPTPRHGRRDLLERFDLADAAGRIVKTYSGGMRRRLDIAASLIARPRVLFLDEPTTGLDPRSRIGMWEFIASLVADGTTILLTTQYLEEADRLADASS